MSPRRSFFNYASGQTEEVALDKSLETEVGSLTGISLDTPSERVGLLATFTFKTGTEAKFVILRLRRFTGAGTLLFEQKITVLPSSLYCITVTWADAINLEMASGSAKSYSATLQQEGATGAGVSEHNSVTAIY